MPRWTTSQYDSHLHQQYHDRHPTRMWNYSTTGIVLILVLVIMMTGTTTTTDAFTTLPSASTSKSTLRRDRSPSMPRSGIVRQIITSLDVNNINIDDENIDDHDDDTVVVTWLDESNDSSSNNKSSQQTRDTATKSKTEAATITTTMKWGSKLSPQVKQRIILAGQQRAISNKQKRISDMDRKRRTCVCIYIVCCG